MRHCALISIFCAQSFFFARGSALNLINKTVVITGGTSGVGYELVKALYPYNTVLVIARPGPRLEQLVDEFKNIEIYPADLSVPHLYEELADNILRGHGQIDLLINNAAVQNTPTFLDEAFDFAAMASEIQLNFTAVCALSYLLLPAMRASMDETVIANINSGLALAPKTQSAVYCATKAAMNVFSQSLSYQLADTSVKVTQAFLPLVDTPMTEGRGSAKLSAQQAALAILAGIEAGDREINVGKVKLLRALLWLVPPLARKIMRGL